MKKLIRILLILLAVAIAVLAAAGGTAWWYVASIFEEPPMPVVAAETRRSTIGGEVVGYVDRLDTNAWLGIPYAAPPVGPLRWRAPQPPEPWSGVRESLVRGPQCPQGELGPGPGLAGDEDCLSVNVWSPTHAADSDRALPVMFWIHGGGNHIGEGGTPLYNGARLAGTHDVVVVSINYRLGPLGWFHHPALATGDPLDDSGNYGVLDIIHALRWVRDNVAAFGGDPGNVTIFGESAGGWNVQALMVSPLAVGLYHKAIAQSGGLRIVPVAEAQEYGPAGRTSFRELVDNLLMADDAGLDSPGARARQESMAEEELAGYLRSKRAQEILAAQGGAGFGGTATLLGDGHVLPDDLQAAELFAAGRYNVTPAIFGTNRDEVKLFAAFSPEATDRLFGFLPYRVRDPERYDRDTGYSSDAWKVGAVDRLAVPLRAAQGPTVFAYRFDWDAMRSVGTLDLARLFGAAHALEIPFVFGTLDFLDRLRVVADDDVRERDALSQTMMSYWAEFAWTGDPGRGRNGEQVEWSAWENGAGARRLLLLDARSDGGVRMSSFLLTMDDLRARLLADTSFSSLEEHCRAYRETFRFENFVQAEYDALGGGGCPAE
ncbi:MAG: carboxylesterase family protein [Gammaproteobacteria bacterium]|nr:carboxylesterase family protein [Gammaproteobacteria bacterium]